MNTLPISHAIVLPDRDFQDWLAPVRPYMQMFERVAVIRSPAGNDLNRFRNITAVQAPNVWFRDDALRHIRRAYPMVVRVDVIQASDPSQLGVELQRRVAQKDRFGQLRNDPKHIYDRFTIEWPSDARPTRISRPFSSITDRNLDTHEGFDIEVLPGASIFAGADGVASRIVPNGDGLNYGPYIQVTSILEGETYIVTYSGLKDIKVHLNDNVKVGDELARAEGNTIKIIVQNPPGGMIGFKLPNVVDPVLMVYWQGLRLRPMVRALRVRDHPSLEGDIIGMVTSSDLLETQEVHGRTLAKIGVTGQWLRIRRAGTNSAYCAAWHLTPVGLTDPVEAFPGVPVPGVNLDLDYRQGTPDPGLLKGQGWVRLVFNVSLNPSLHEGHPNRYGNTDVDFTFNRYRPVLERYARAGKKIILVMTHQTFGEGQGYVWPQMDRGKWRDLTTRYADVVRRVAAKFASTGLVYAYQIWNEQDTPSGKGRAAVPIPADDYAHLLGATILAIRQVDRRVKIITGGHVGSPESGAEYARRTLQLLRGVRPNGIAFHPYGRGPQGHPYSIHGSINHAVRVYSRVLPNTPLWITEWGILNAQGNDSIAGQVSQYATGFLNELRAEFRGQIAAAIWYAWADGMDNGYGIVRSDGSPRQPLFSTYLK